MENKNFRKRYFFFDIDGTLAVGNPGRYIPKSAKDAIEKLESQGHFCAIATGRSQAMAFDYCQEIGFKNMVSDGGNGITIDNKLIKIDPLERESVVKLLEECDEKGFAWAISYDNSKVRYTKSPKFVENTKDTYMKTIVDENLDLDKIDIIYKSYIACTVENEGQIENLQNVPFARYQDAYVFVEPDDKSVGIKSILDYYHAPYEDAVVFGDNKNDLKMFRDEWTSIAMGNAIDELKERATFVTKDAVDDGIAYACKHFNWI